jgi:hypothetical protein
VRSPNQASSCPCGHIGHQGRQRSPGLPSWRPSPPDDLRHLGPQRISGLRSHTTRKRPPPLSVFCVGRKSGVEGMGEAVAMIPPEPPLLGATPAFS